MKEKNRTSTGSNVLISVVSFFLSLTLIFLSAMVVSELTLFNDRDILAKISGTNYYSQLNEDITLKCKTIAAKYGVEYEAISEVITPVKIDTDMTVYFNSIKIKDPAAAGKTINADSLEKQLFESFQAKDPLITDSQKASVQTAASLIAKAYKDAIVIENFESFMLFTREYKPVSRYVFFGLLALFAYLFCVIMALNGKTQKHRLLRRYAVCTGSAGLTVVCISLVIKFTNIVERITFASSEREYKLFVDMFSDFIRSFSIVGGCWVMLAVVLLSLWYLSVTGRTRRFI